jgi:hypothetical protein
MPLSEDRRLSNIAVSRRRTTINATLLERMPCFESQLYLDKGKRISEKMSADYAGYTDLWRKTGDASQNRCASTVPS